MYDIISKQFQRGDSLVQEKYKRSLEKELWPPFHVDLAETTRDYYHELNPFFLHNVHKSDLLKLSDVLTVRDGYLTFGSFLLKNYKRLSRFHTKIYFVHPQLVPLIPQEYLDLFATWEIVQKNPIPLETASKIILYGILNEDNIGNLNTFTHRLQSLKRIKSDAEVSVYLPLKKNFIPQGEEDFLLIHHVMNIIKSTIPNHKINILSTKDFFTKNSFKSTLVLDLAYDQYLISDNFVHYHVLSKGGSVNLARAKNLPKSIFSFDLSLYHELHISPLPSVASIFGELLYYRRCNPMVEDFTKDFLFQDILKLHLRGTTIPS